MKIAIASDHAGFKMKEAIKASYPNIEWLDLGATGEESTDFPDYAFTLAMAVAGNHAERGVLVCSTGVGMSMAANRHPMIRAALCTNTDMAKFARSHNDANVICMGAKYMDLNLAKDMIDTFLNTPFSALDRYVRRNKKLMLQDEGCHGDGSCGHDHGHDDHDHTTPGGGCCGGGCH
jgi:ribose 5-phosphate isomerase B